MSIEKVLGAIGGRRYDLSSEYAVQKEIEDALVAGGVEFKREFALSKRDRPDFLCQGGVVVEVKIKAGMRPRETLRQISRYCQDLRVHSVILATGRTCRMPSELEGGKKIIVFSLSQGAL